MQIKKCTLIKDYPVIIKVDSEQKAEVTIEKGIGYLPITITGLNSYKGWCLERKNGDKWIKVDQSVHGNDYWQTDYDGQNNKWEITYNVLMDRENINVPEIFRFYKTEIMEA